MARIGKRTKKYLARRIGTKYLRWYRKRLVRRLKALWRPWWVASRFPGWPIRADLRALRSWRGQSPRVALRNYIHHPLWWTYQTHPPLRYAPSPVAQLDHWVEVLPEVVLPSRKMSRGRRATRRGKRPHILDVEHWSLLTPAGGQDWDDAFWEWDRVVANKSCADARVRADECKAVIMVSRGAVEQAREVLSPEAGGKLDYVFPAYPPQPEAENGRHDTFTLLTIANRVSDEGVPEALRAFEALRERHGPRIRMVVVSNRVGREHPLPEGVDLCSTDLMGPDLKARIYRSADVLVLPSYWDSVMCYVEASAFGVPTLTTRLHHGEDFVQDGRTGYLIDPPIYAYGEGYGTRWRRQADFTAELAAMRERGGLDGVVEDLVDRLELLVSCPGDREQMGAAARRLHAERFSPEVRNAKLNGIYERALRA